MKRKFIFIIALLSGSIAIITNAIVYYINYKHELSRDAELKKNATVTLLMTPILTQEAMHPNPHFRDHDHHHEHRHDGTLVGLVKIVLNFLLINIDPVLSIVLSIIYMIFFMQIFKLAALILAQSVPASIDVTRVQNDIKQLVCFLFVFVLNS